MSDEIWIDCEGAGARPPRVDSFRNGVCPMCGVWFPIDLVLPPHKRDDILARIDRGDFS